MAVRERHYKPQEICDFEVNTGHSLECKEPFSLLFLKPWKAQEVRI